MGSDGVNDISAGAGEGVGGMVNATGLTLGSARRAGSDGSMSASGSAGPGFDPWQGSKFSILGLGGEEMYTF